MRIIIEIPNYDFDNDVKDKFQDYFERVKADIADGTLCGNYELETTDMFLASFKRLQVLPDNATNGDMLKAVFTDIETEPFAMTVHASTKVTCNGVKGSISYDFWKEWWNAPYKEDSK